MGFVLGTKSCISVILNVFMLVIEACGDWPVFILMVSQRQEDAFKFQASLNYIVSSMPI